MTLLEQLQAHKGGLIQLKTQLYWYGTRSYDNNPGQVCLILDAATATASIPAAATAAADAPIDWEEAPAGAFLLIDGQPQWIWVAKEDVELLVNDPPTN